MRMRSSAVNWQTTLPSTTNDVPSCGSGTTSSYTRSAESTTGRLVSVCGLIGEITNACKSLSQDRSPRRQVVGRRADRSADNQAIATISGHQFTVNVKLHVEDRKWRTC